MPGAPSGGGAAVCPLTCYESVCARWRVCMHVRPMGWARIRCMGNKKLQQEGSPKNIVLGVACAYWFLKTT